jgi:hypothetical protein
LTIASADLLTQIIGSRLMGEELDQRRDHEAPASKSRRMTFIRFASRGNYLRAGDRSILAR